MMHFDFIKNSLNQAQTTLQEFIAIPGNIRNIEAIILELSQGLSKGKRIFSCGNGGSMCDAMHFAEELTGRFRKDRSPLPAMAICDPGHLTCVTNDFGADYVFSRVVEAWGKEGDFLLAISTSGKSKNVIEATLSAKQKGMHVIGLLGKGGGAMKDICTYSIVIPSDTTERIQEIHIKMIHIIIEGIERCLFPELYEVTPLLTQTKENFSIL